MHSENTHHPRAGSFKVDISGEFPCSRVFLADLLLGSHTTLLLNPVTDFWRGVTRGNGVWCGVSWSLLLCTTVMYSECSLQSGLFSFWCILLSSAVLIVPSNHIPRDKPNCFCCRLNLKYLWHLHRLYANVEWIDMLPSVLKRLLHFEQVLKGGDSVDGAMLVVATGIPDDIHVVTIFLSRRTEHCLLAIAWLRSCWKVLRFLKAGSMGIVLLFSIAAVHFWYLVRPTIREKLQLNQSSFQIYWRPYMMLLLPKLYDQSTGHQLWGVTPSP